MWTFASSTEHAHVGFCQWAGRAAFRSHETPPFSQMLSTLFNNSNGEQRAGILKKLLASVGPSLLTSGTIGVWLNCWQAGR